MIIKSFSGIKPRQPEHLLNENQAVKAHNVNLQHGTLYPWREVLLVHDFAQAEQTLEVYGCNYFAWSNKVSIARWIPDCPRLYITGHAAYPEVALIGSDGTLTYQRLGVFTPDTIPVLSFITATDKSVETSNRSYIFTYVNNLEEESGPSYPSSDIVVNDGQAITVSGWTTSPAPEYNITSVRLYRSATGFRMGDDKEQKISTAYELVAEIPIATGQYIDTVMEENLSYAFAAREVREPPAALQGIIDIPEAETLVGFVGNKLYFCRNSQPWNWPVELELTLDYNIMGLGADNGKLFITTTGTPYIADAIADCGKRPCRPVSIYDYPFPDIGCHYTHGRIITPFGLVYASVEGLVLLSHTLAPTVITDAVLASRDWVLLKPDTTRLAYWQGWLICVTDAVSFFFLLDRATYAVQEQLAIMTTVSDTPIDMVLSDSGELLMMNSDGKVYQWNAGTTKRPYEWITAVYAESQHWLPVARIQVDGKVNFTIAGENGEIYSRDVVSNRPFRVKRNGRNRKVYLMLTGTGEVSYIRVGETMIDESNH